MAPAPREGIERIILKLKGGERLLSRRVVPAWELGESNVFTQRLFLASPGGRFLAWSDPKGALRVRDARGRERVIEAVEGRDARFSADERHLAAVRRDGGTGFEVVVLDTGSGDRRVLGAIGAPGWLEWVADGVVVSHQKADQILITYLPLEGEPVQVASGASADLQTRFVTAKRGHRAMYFFRQRAFLVDVQSAEADAREVGELPGQVDNAEMAPDGSEAALVIGGALHRWRQGGELTRLATDAAHTVWYSADGRRLAWAAHDRAVVLEGDTRREITTEKYDLQAMRFRGDQLVVSMGARAFLWNPRTGARKTLGAAGKGRTVQAADVYAGGAVLWTRELRKTDRRRAARNAPPEPFALAH